MGWGYVPGAQQCRSITIELGRCTAAVKRAVRMAVEGTMDANHVLRGQYWLTRVVLLRCLGFVYAAAFLSALRDNAALVRLRKICR